MQGIYRVISGTSRSVPSSRKASDLKGLVPQKGFLVYVHHAQYFSTMAETGDANGTQTREKINTFIKKAIETYEDYDFKDMDLWESFKEDFKDYTE